MTVKDMRAMLELCPDDMPVLIKHFGDFERDKPDVFEAVGNIEVESVKGVDTFTIAGY